MPVFTVFHLVWPDGATGCTEGVDTVVRHPKEERLREVWQGWLSSPDTAALKYRRVAHVAACDMNDAFRRTNHIYSDWTEGSGVTMLYEPPGGQTVRSTSIGDVIVDADSVAWGVAVVGFYKL